MKSNSKNIFIYGTAFLFLAVLAGVLVSFLLRSDGGKKEQWEVSAVNVRAYDGETVFFEEKGNAAHPEDGSLSGAFLTLEKMMTKANEVPLTSHDTAAFSVSFEPTEPEEGEEVPENREYVFTFCPEEGIGYAVGTTGDTFVFDNRSLSVFFERDDVWFAFPNAYFPRLIASSGLSVEPISANWSYGKTEGKTGNHSQKPVDTVKLSTCNLFGTLSFRFDRMPDSVSLTLYQGKTLLYDSGAPEKEGEQPLDEIALLSCTPGETYHLRLTAVWEKKDDNASFGSVEYDFYAAVREMPDFYLSSDKTEQGGVLYLRASHIYDPDSLTIEGIPFAASPDVLSEGEESDTVCAVLTVAKDAPTGVQTLTFTYGSIEESRTVTVSEKLPAHPEGVPTEVSASEFKKIRSDDMEKVIGRIVKIVESEKYFAGIFGDPADEFGDAAVGFSDNMIHTTASTYSSNGKIYTDPSVGGTAVSAIAPGRVVAVGTSSAFGQYVAVSHGRGIVSFYGSLSSVSVEEGDVIRKGEAVGLTGTVALTGERGFELRTTVGKRYVDPDAFLGKSLDVDIPLSSAPEP